ncbi:MAG: MFS transporter [Pseudomonadota bacterium]
MSFLRENARWLAAGFVMTFMSTFGQTYFIALFSGEIRAELGLSHGEFGTIYGLATLLSAATLVWLGKIADRENLALVGVFVAAALGAAALGMSLVAGSVMLFFVLFLLRLFGQGMMTHTSQTAMGRWFVATRGRAIAISGFGFPTSEAIFPILVVALLAFFDWRTLWVIVSGILIFAAAPGLFLLLMKSREPKGQAEDKDQTGVARQWTRADVLRDPVFFVLLPALLAPAFIGTGIFFHQVHLVETKGWELSWFAGAFPLYAAFSVATALGTGFLVDRFTAKRVMPLVLVPQAIAVFLFAEFSDRGVIPVAMALTGMTAGLMSTVTGALWPEIYGTKHLGAIRSIAMAAMVLASAGSPFLLGILIDFGISFDRQLFVMGLYMIAATLVLLNVSRTLVRRNNGFTIVEI